MAVRELYPTYSLTSAFSFPFQSLLCLYLNPFDSSFHCVSLSLSCTSVWMLDVVLVHSINTLCSNLAFSEDTVINSGMHACI